MQILLVILILALLKSPVFADSHSNDIVGDTGSITLTRIYGKAEELRNQKQYAKAILEYRKAISKSPDFVDFYIGLEKAALEENDWSTVNNSIENIIRLDPAYKPDYLIDYGDSYYHMAKYDQALKILNEALAYVDKNITSDSLHKAQQEKLDKDQATMRAKLEQHNTNPTPIASANIPKVEDNVDIPIVDISKKDSTNDTEVVKKSKADNKEVYEAFRFTYDTALKSECILLATYEGYDNSDDIRYNHPPKAFYKIKKILKGPPLNPALPVRYDFHMPKDIEPPSNWHFSKEMMPKPGSTWLLFIENALSKHGMYETYQGSYGRQEANDENLNKIYDLIDKSSGQ